MEKNVKLARAARILGLVAVSVLASSLAMADGHDGSHAGHPPAKPAPTVTAVAPANGATGVHINVLVTAAFSEPMAPFTDEAKFTVACEAPCVSLMGSVTLDTSNTIATFTPTSNLAPNTLYTATISGASSLASSDRGRGDGDRGDGGRGDGTCQSRSHHDGGGDDEGGDNDHGGCKGVEMAKPFIWHFTTGATADTTRPRVILTVPATTTPGPTAGVPANTAITATFSEDMAPATITAASFTVTCAAPCISPAGAAVSYAVGSQTAVFTPATALTVGATYTATITTAATDLAGNALAGNQTPLPAASDYVWTFTTGVPVPPANVAVVAINPAAGEIDVCPSTTINATFSVANGLRMNPVTVNTTTFRVTGPGPAFTPIMAASVVLDAATGKIASFTPLNPLSDGVTYTVTILGGANGVKDLAIPADTLANNFTWSFTAGPSTGSCQTPIALGSASAFGLDGGGAGMTNQGILTVINGDIATTAVSTGVTGFHDLGVGCTYTETPLNVGAVNGKIYTAPPPPTVSCPTEGTAVTFAIAQQAHADALAAYNALVALPPGSDPGAGNLANLVLTPGVYTAAAGTFMIVGGDLTLDAQGNANAVWVFQMATSLTVGGPGAAFPQSVILVNGAQAKNVYWQVGSAATINAAGGGIMVGTIISQAGATFSTAGNLTPVTLDGRVLSLGASVTLVNTVINVPAP